MKKNLFLRLCLILLIVLTAYSCRTDQFPENETFNNSSKFQLTSKRISLNEAKHKTQLITELSEAKNEFKKLSKSNANGKTVSFGDSISVNTDNVIYMENGPDYHTYTFSIQRNNPLPDAAVENLVLTPLPDGGYKAYLVTYNLTEAEKNTIINGGNVEVNNKSVVTPLEGNFSSVLGRIECSEYIYDYYTWCGEGKHNNGEICNSKDGVYSQHVVIIGIKCSGGNPMLPVTNPVDSGSGSGEAGGATPTNPCSVNGVYINPQDPSNSTCNGGVATQPNLEFNFAETPCAKMKTQNENVDFKAKVSALDKAEIFTKDVETGYAAAYGPQTAYQQMDNTPNGNVRLPDGNKYFGYLHSHLDKEGAVKIFSPYDISTFMTSCVRNAKLKGSMTDAYAMVITSQGNYILKYSGDGNFNITYGQFADWRIWYDKEYDLLAREDKFTQPNIEKLFTQFLKEKVNISGLELYKIDKTTGKATRLEYDGKGNPVKTTPCPLQ